MTNHIWFNDLPGGGRKDFPLKISPCSPGSFYPPVCFSVSPHYPYPCACIILFFCSLFLCSFLTFPPTFLLTFYLIQDKQWAGSPRGGSVGVDWLSLPRQWGVKRLPRCCNSSLRATLATCMSTHTHTHTNSGLKQRDSNRENPWQIRAPTQIKNTTENTKMCFWTQLPVWASERVKTYAHT